MSGAPPPVETVRPLAQVAAHRLRGAAAGAPADPLAPGDWQSLLAGVEEERLAGLLVQAIEDGAWPVTGAQRAEAGELQTREMTLSLELERLLLRVQVSLERAGTDWRVLKGLASAHLSYPDPSWRSFGDVDLLVRGEDLDGVADRLGALGFVRTAPEPRRGFDRRFGKGAPLRSPSGSEIDLHRTLVRGPLAAAIDPELLFSETSSFVLAGQKVTAMAPEERLLHASLHAVVGSGSPRLSTLRDIGQILLHEGIDTTRLQELARAWRVEAVLAGALRAMAATLGVADQTALLRWAGAYRPRPARARVLRAYALGADHPRYQLETLRAMGRWGDRVAYGWALLAPDHAYVAAGHRSGRARILHGLSRAGGLLGRG